MRIILKSVIFIIILAILLYGSYFIYKTYRLSHINEKKVLLVYNPTNLLNNYHILRAYKSVLEEEGVSYEIVSPEILLSLMPGNIATNNRVIIFPDGIVQFLPEELKFWATSYLKEGGNLVIIYDAGTKNNKGIYLDKTIFTDIVGINYITYDKTGNDAYTKGYIKFTNKGIDLFQIPTGKIKEKSLLGGYAYGKLTYPVARNDPHSDIKGDEIYSLAVTEDGEEYPAIIIRDYEKGKVLYVNLPLGYLKAYSDDLPLRAVLRSFLLRVVKIPYLVNVPFGKGGMVINWHVDANSDWKSISFMLDNNYLRKDIKYSFHITAGDFRDRPGDGLGFEACGKGRQFINIIQNFGLIGSHGGWAHNWFSENINKGNFGKKEIHRYIKMNNDCLESLTGYTIREYSAPNGVHPQPLKTDVLANLGFIAYYYTGDTGSTPNRTFINGRKVSDKIIAFPIMPFEKSASFFEMKQFNKTEEEVKDWLIETTNYVVRNRTVRLIYSHPYDIPHYPLALKSFLDYIEVLQQEGSLVVDTMDYFADFLLRFLKTMYSFKTAGNKMNIELKNNKGLYGITIAIPKGECKRPDPKGFGFQEDNDYYYLTIMEKINRKTISLDML